MSKKQKNKPTVSPATTPVQQSAAMSKKSIPVTADPTPKKAAVPIRQLILVLAAISFVVYANTLVNGFALDDEIVVKSNTMVARGISAIPELLSTPHMRGYLIVPNDTYRPLSLVTYAMERQFFGVNTTLNHFFNILFFIGCTIYFFLFLNKFFKGNAIIAFIGALLFAVHPLHTEVVANIKSRDELMCFFFAFMSLTMFVKYMDKGKMLQLLIGIITLFLAFLSKETVIAFVGIVPILFFFYYNADKRRAAYITGATVFTAIAFIGIRHMVLSAYQANVSSDIEFIDNALTKAPDAITRFATAILINGNYLKQMFIPYPLVCNYSYNSIPFASFANIGTLLSLAAYGFLIYYAIKSLVQKKKDPFAFSILYFIISLSLFSNIFMLIGAEMAERFTFFATGGFCIAAAAALQKWIIKEELQDINVFKKPMVAVLLIPVCLLFAGLTMARNSDWKDNYSLYLKDIEKSPDDCRLSYYLGTSLAEEKYEEEKDPVVKTQIDRESIIHLQRALSIYAGFSEANVELGRVYDREKKYDSAEHYDVIALKINPNHLLGNNNLGSVYLATGRYQQAVTCYKKALSINPEFYLADYNLARTYVQLHQFDSAIMFFNKTLQIKPDYFDVFNELGMAYFNKQDYDKAEVQFKKVLQINPDEPNAINNLGAIYLNTKKYPLAIEQFTKAIKINPNYINAYSNLGRSYYFSQQYAQAVDIFTKEINLDPKSYRDIPYMALSYNSMGQKEMALKYEAIAKHYYSDFKLP